MDEKSVVNWTAEDVKNWLIKEDLSETVVCVVYNNNRLDGSCILALNQQDFSEFPLCELQLRDKKQLLLKVKSLQRSNHDAMVLLGLVEDNVLNLTSANVNFVGTNLSSHLAFNGRVGSECHDAIPQYFDNDAHSRSGSEDGRASKLKPEIWKAFISLCYVFFVTWINAVVMVIVHDKVPDMNKYPPLPDLFLDNVPHIPWAFDMCEIIGSVMMAIWVVVLLFHKHRFILIRRFFALAGTVFLLRCITMMITSLSVPGSHLKCAPRRYPPTEAPYADWGRRLQQAYDIWSGAGMSVRGVRTCGDYMFSGHTVALTLLNFFITEYTTRNLYIVHIISWVINMFGIFFILAAHEHYSIDVFIAFYITSRLFLYYHTLSNNQALVMGDSMRTRIWFPLLSFFESEVDGIVPNEYESPLTCISGISLWFTRKKNHLSENTVTWLAGQNVKSVDFSVNKLFCNIKRNLNLVEATVKKSPNTDKNVQAGFSELNRPPDYFDEVQALNIALLEQHISQADINNKKSL